MIFWLPFTHPHALLPYISCMWLYLYQCEFGAREKPDLCCLFFFPLWKCVAYFWIIFCYRTTFSWFLYLRYPFKKMTEAKILLGLFPLYCNHLGIFLINFCYLHFLVCTLIKPSHYYQHTLVKRLYSQVYAIVLSKFYDINNFTLSLYRCESGEWRRGWWKK